MYGLKEEFIQGKQMNPKLEEIYSGLDSLYIQSCFSTEG